MVEELLEDDVREERFRGHALVQRRRRKRSDDEDLALRVRQFRGGAEHHLVADDAADVHLLGDEDEAFGHLGLPDLAVVLRVLHLRIEVFLPDRETGGVHHLADLAVMLLDVDEPFAGRLVLRRLGIQASLLLGIYRVVEKAQLEGIRIDGKVFLGTLAVQLLLQVGDAVVFGGDLTVQV